MTPKHRLAELPRYMVDHGYTTHDKGGVSQDLAQRFWSKVDKRGPNECWLWLGGRSSAGYGRFGLSRLSQPGMIGAHRMAWELTHGQKVPDGHLICHRCDNPPCVNPAHLWAGTYCDNNRDRVIKGRDARAARTHCRHGHEYTPENTRIDRGGRQCRICENASHSRSYYRRRAAERAASC